jgi:putative membrane protein
MNRLDRFLSRFGRPLLLVAWFYALAGLLPGQAYTAFLRPEFGALLGVAVLVLVGFLFAELRQWGHGRAFGMDGAIRSLILLVPLACLSLARGASLDSRAFEHRWIGMAGTNIVSSGENAEAPMNAAPSSSVVAEVTLVDLSSDPARYKGQRVAVVGMIHRDPKTTERFGADACVLFRFVINCCAADARPVAIILAGNVPTHWSDNTWIRAEGLFSLRDDKGQPVPTLEVSMATRIPKPRRPYLY